MRNPSLLQTFQRFLQTGWHRLTAPADSIRQSPHRQQAQLFSIMMLIWLITSFILLIVFLLSPRILPNASLGAPLAILIAILLLYALSRTRFYRLAIFAFVCLTYGLLFAIHLTHPHISPERILSFLVITVFVVGVLETLWHSIFISIMHLALLIVFAFLSDVPNRYFPVFILNLIVSALVIVMAYVRLRDIERIVESEARYRNLMEANFEAVIVCDLETSTILDINRAFEDMFGYARDAVIGQSLQRFSIPPGDPAQQRKTYAPTEIVAFHREGHPLNLEVVSYTQPVRDTVVQVCVLRDITANKHLGNQQIELAIQKERVKMLSGFIDDASHHFRTPITSMKTSLYLIEKLIHKPERREQHIQVMKTEMERLEHLLDNLLTMTRLEKEETGDFSYIGQFDLNGLLRELTVTYPQWKQDQPDVHMLTLELDLPLVFGDKRQLGSALRHLLDNALLYSEPDGRIEIRTYSDDNLMQVYLEIQDEGIGIAARDIPYIFKNFYRSDAARDKAPDHIGLGLGIAKKIIDRHRGAVHVESQVGQGATFRVVLPTINAMPGAVRRIATEDEKTPT